MNFQDLLQDAIDKGEGGFYKIPKPEPVKFESIWTIHPLLYKDLLIIKQSKK